MNRTEIESLLFKAHAEALKGHTGWTAREIDIIRAFGKECFDAGARMAYRDSAQIAMRELAPPGRLNEYAAPFSAKAAALSPSRGEKKEG